MLSTSLHFMLTLFLWLTVCSLEKMHHHFRIYLWKCVIFSVTYCIYILQLCSNKCTDVLFGSNWYHSYIIMCVHIHIYTVQLETQEDKLASSDGHGQQPGALTPAMPTQSGSVVGAKLQEHMYLYMGCVYPLTHWTDFTGTSPHTHH